MNGLSAVFNITFLDDELRKALSLLPVEVTGTESDPRQ